jgi:hypothetical protein
MTPPFDGLRDAPEKQPNFLKLHHFSRCAADARLKFDGVDTQVRVVADADTVV